MDSMTQVFDIGRVRVITLDREAQLNALCIELILELTELIKTAESDDSIGCVVIQGAGNRAFCAGADLSEIYGADAESARHFINTGHTLMNTVAHATVPIIAAVDGWALGGGMELSMACHIIVASSEAKFGLPEAKIGCMPGFGGTQRIFAHLSKSAAMRLLLSGDPLNAAEAHEFGLLAFAPCAPEQLQDTAIGLAEKIANGSKTGQERILCATAQATAPAALEYEAALAAAAISSRDGQEGIRAFNDKRPVVFLRGSDD